MITTNDRICVVLVVDDLEYGGTQRQVVELAFGIRELSDSPEPWQKASHGARQYYLDNHTVDAVMPSQYEQEFVDLSQSLRING